MHQLDKTKHGNTRDKSWISETPEQKHLKDEIYTRVVELENDKSVFGADLYYHRTRLLN